MIERTEADGIEVVRLDHGKVNALDLELTIEIESTFRDLEQGSCRAVVLTGTGTAFSAGVDLRRLLEEGVPYVMQFLPVLDDMIRTVFMFPKPLVCAINGHAIAGGGLLAVSGDARLMADGNGKIGLPELLVGVPFPPYALEMMRLSMEPRALERFLYSGVTIGPAEAVDAGLVDRVVAPDELEAAARKEAERLARIDPGAFRVTKSQLRGRTEERVKALGKDAESHTIELWTSETTLRNIREYLDRTVGK